jgi:hypothetical protein
MTQQRRVCADARAAPQSRHQPSINHDAGLLESNASREESIKVDGTFA